MRILGIDPGNHITGYGVVEKDKGQWIHIDCGLISPPRSLTPENKLVYIFNKVQELIGQFGPQVCAIEDVFYAKNIKSTLRLGQARGSAIVAASILGIEIVTYLPTEVKKAISGYGRASKEQVQTMIERLLQLPEKAPTDASDALAVALCHAHTIKFKQMVSQA